jgi:cytochrome P450
MLRDERVWPEPKKFRPERFLTPWGDLDHSVKNTEDIAFGFGR